MGKCMIIPNGFLTIAKTNIECPKCKTVYEYDFYKYQIEKSSSGLIYKTCKECKSKIGVTTDMKGDAVCWLKSSEQKLL